MTDPSKFFADLGALLNQGIATAAGCKQEVETRLREQFSFLLKDHGLVTREEFDVLKDVIAKQQKEIDHLKKSVNNHDQHHGSSKKGTHH